MADAEQLARLKSGVKEWNDWRSANPDAHIDLAQADLHAANLAGAVLFGAVLRGATLTGANLSGADLIGANLTGANLTGANLTGASLLFADLTNTTLSNADLTGAFLTGADFTNANLTDTDFRDANLSNALNLASATSGPGTLYSLATDFTGTGFDPVAAGWTLVAEPIPALSTEGLLLLCLLLTGLGIGAAHRIQRRAPLGSA